MCDLRRRARVPSLRPYDDVSSRPMMWQRSEASLRARHPPSPAPSPLKDAGSRGAYVHRQGSHGRAAAPPRGRALVRPLARLVVGPCTHSLRRADAESAANGANPLRSAATVVARDAPYAPGTTAPAWLTGSLPGCVLPGLSISRNAGRAQRATPGRAAADAARTAAAEASPTLRRRGPGLRATASAARRATTKCLRYGPVWLDICRAAAKHGALTRRTAAPQ